MPWRRHWRARRRASCPPRGRRRDRLLDEIDGGVDQHSARRPVGAAHDLAAFGIARGRVDAG
jgi:hypothetical protein